MLKFLVIIIGSFLGTVFLVIQWMQARQYIQGQVDWSRVGNDTMVWLQSFSAQVGAQGGITLVAIKYCPPSMLEIITVNQSKGDYVGG